MNRFMRNQHNNDNKNDGKQEKTMALRSLFPAPTRPHPYVHWLFAATLLTVSITGGNRSSAQTASHLANSLLQKAVFAKGLAKNQEPIKPTSDFFPTETVCLSLQLKGRPSKGIASAKFYFGDRLISEAKINVSEVNKGVLFSLGSSTFAGFSLVPNTPLPISDNYRAETFFDAKPLGTFKFRVVPPADAIPAKIIEAVTAKGVDDKRAPVKPGTIFGVSQPVYLAIRGDLGTGSGVEVNWYVQGKLDPAGTKSLTVSKNLPNTRFYFAFMPKGEWKPGSQEAVLTLNGKEAGRYAFTIK